MHVSWASYRLVFNKPAGTSRGVLHHKTSYFLALVNGTERLALGECGLLEGLSCDDLSTYEETLNATCRQFNATGNWPNLHALAAWPSIRFGWEMLIREAQNGYRQPLFNSPFARGLTPIEINGLIWMDDLPGMREQIFAKLATGNRCLKLKIGHHDTARELELLQALRADFPAHQLEIRVDANGAYHRDTVFHVLDALGKLDVHSIEQPVPPSQRDLLRECCRHGAVNVALDESLIGLHQSEEQQKLLDEIGPQYIILKPSLLGGWEASEAWIALAAVRNIGWWATSALESAVGLNAIAQWVAHLAPQLPQGLGTGKIYSNNVVSPLYEKGGELWFKPEKTWDLDAVWPTNN